MDRIDPRRLEHQLDTTYPQHEFEQLITSVGVGGESLPPPNNITWATDGNSVLRHPGATPGTLAEPRHGQVQGEQVGICSVPLIASRNRHPCGELGFFCGSVEGGIYICVQC
ncbi:hypothetical protein JOQ06_005506, partial [Pogonophryne albipinna]